MTFGKIIWIVYKKRKLICNVAIGILWTDPLHILRRAKYTFPFPFKPPAPFSAQNILVFIFL